LRGELTKQFEVWESLEDIGKFERTESESAAILQLKNRISHDPAATYYMKFSPSIPHAALTSPIVEMLTFYGLPAGSAEEGLAGFLAMVASTEGCLGIAKGPFVEKLDSGNDDELAKAFLAAIGWTSLEANVKGQKS
jgi:hypothetical protein